MEIRDVKTGCRLQCGGSVRGCYSTARAQMKCRVMVSRSQSTKSLFKISANRLVVNRTDEPPYRFSSRSASFLLKRSVNRQSVQKFSSQTCSQQDGQTVQSLFKSFTFISTDALSQPTVCSKIQLTDS